MQATKAGSSNYEHPLLTIRSASNGEPPRNVGKIYEEFKAVMYSTEGTDDYTIQADRINPDKVSLTIRSPYKDRRAFISYVENDTYLSQGLLNKFKQLQDFQAFATGVERAGHVERVWDSQPKAQPQPEAKAQEYYDSKEYRQYKKEV